MKTTMKYHCTSLKVVFKKLIKPSANEIAEQLKVHPLLVRMQNGTVILENRKFLINTHIYAT